VDLAGDGIAGILTEHATAGFRAARAAAMAASSN